MKLRSKRIHQLFLVLLSGALVLTGCSGQADDDTVDGGTRTVDFGYGPIEIPADPQRVVALWGAADALLTLEDSPLVAVGEGHPLGEHSFGENTAAWERFQELPNVGKATEPNYEAILELDPDLILASVPGTYWEDANAERLQAIAPTVNVRSPEAESPGAWKDDYLAAADIVGLSEQAAEKKDQYEARIAEIRDTYSDQIDSLTFVAVASWEAGIFYTQNADSYLSTVPLDLGFTLPTTASAEFSIEELPTELEQYDVIIYGSGPGGVPTPETQALLDSPLFQGLSAVRAGNVIALAYDVEQSFDAAMVALDSLESGLAQLSD